MRRKLTIRSILVAAIASSVLRPQPAAAEVSGVTIASRVVVADGRAFGGVGSYEKLAGRIEFALDPSDPHNRGIVDLQYAPRGADGVVRFSSDLFVLRPVDPTRTNGVLFFEVANRGRMGLLTQFNRATAGGNDPMSAADFGDGLLMRDGYTIVYVGWEFDVPAPLLRIDAPPVRLPANESRTVDVEIMVNTRSEEAFLIDDPAGRPPAIYEPESPASSTDRLSVRDRFWDDGAVVPRGRWSWVVSAGARPKIRLEGGFDPGRYYRVTYRGAHPVVTGVGLAAIRDAASAFRYRTDLPVRGRSAYVFGQSQTGRFLREFLHDGFNVDERGRRVFDAVWAHVAGAAHGSFNARFATASSGSVFKPTQFPFTDDEQQDTNGTRDGLQVRYAPEQRPKVFYTNTPVEYWGGGRAAALTHTSIDGARDLVLPENVRSYLLSGTQHIVASFPPVRLPPASGAQLSPADRSGGQQLNNPTPHANTMRGLLHALHEWVANGTLPPGSRYPRLADRTLVQANEVAFPRIAGLADPRTIAGPARLVNGRPTPLPFLVPQVDSDGNDRAGIRDPEVEVPLATTTGWNFRSAAIGNPADIYQLIGSYIPFAATRAEATGASDPRPSIEERYRDQSDYLARINAAVDSLIRDRFMLAEDRERVVDRARAHWAFATTGRTATSAAGR